MQKIFTVYKITDKTNNKVYIGVTSQDIESRLKGHISKAEGGSQLKLHKMIMEHGKENFVISEVEVTTDKNIAPELEKKYIKLFQSNNPDYGYNISEGGEYVMITEAMRIAMSEGQQGCIKPRLRKGVIQFAATGEFLKEYPSVAEAARQNNMSPEALRRHFRGCYDYTNEKVLKRLKYIWKLKN